MNLLFIYLSSHKFGVIDLINIIVHAFFTILSRVRLDISDCVLKDSAHIINQVVGFSITSDPSDIIFAFRSDRLSLCQFVKLWLRLLFDIMSEVFAEINHVRRCVRYCLLHILEKWRRG